MGMQNHVGFCVTKLGLFFKLVVVLTIFLKKKYALAYDRGKGFCYYFIKMNFIAIYRLLKFCAKRAIKFLLSL